MEKLKALVRRGWVRYRRWPMWGQIGAGVVVLSVVVGPFLDETKKADSDDKSSETIAESTTTLAAQTRLEPVDAAIAEGNVAECNDGSFSANTDFSATCSSHDDVKAWLSPYGQCADGTVIEMAESASCDDNAGFQALLPADFVPVTTTSPTTSTTPPTTTLPVVLLGSCAELQQRRDGLACAPTGYGPLWIEAPFSNDVDQVSMLGSEDSADGAVGVDEVTVVAVVFKEFESYSQRYWCVTVALKNFSDDERSYNMLDFQLLTPSGNLQTPTIPLVSDTSALLSYGALSVEGAVSGGLCFDEPRSTSGRFAVVYKPLSFLSDARALFYFDR